jgi:diguanylate cyclase (GGDEF)-like protein
MIVAFATTGLIIQWIGILLILGLLTFLTQSIRRPALDQWAIAWAGLAGALTALTLDFTYPTRWHLLRTAYFLGEYTFAYFLLAGCRTLALERRPRHTARWLSLATALALFLTWISSDFNLQFALHAAVMGALFWASFLTLRKARARDAGPGLTVMLTALALLGIDFTHYVPMFLVAVSRGPLERFAYLEYTSTIDLLIETVLGFGIVMVTMERLRREAESASRELTILAQTDPLTSALNRHAYESLVRQAGAPAAVAGCVVVADLDHLKQINDRGGHAAGDLAIRQVATAIRAVIRADDHLFRWGGDEFLVVLPQLDEAEAHRRLESANALLAGQSSGVDGISLAVSYGIASFSGSVPIDAAIGQADVRMYAQKHPAP